MLDSNYPARHEGEAGNSLLEIVVVVAIVVLITAMSIIAFGRAKASYQLSQKAQSLAEQIERARSLAIKYNKKLTLGFTSENKYFGFTCSDCSDEKTELPAATVPTDVSFSAYPTITIKGNGTMSSTSSTIVLTDSDDRQVTISLNNSGRVVVSGVEDNS